jgi:hypothetical protein
MGAKTVSFKTETNISSETGAPCKNPFFENRKKISSETGAS